MTHRVFYHGTSAANWESIRTEGLIPAKGRGGDYWAKYSDNIQAQFMRLMSGPRVYHDGPDTVYMTPIERYALGYAEYAAEVTGSVPVVLRITPPQPLDLIPDSQDMESHAVRYAGTIPASWITEVKL